MFYELFEIPKVRYNTPGRTYDDNGVCEHYTEEVYPEIEPVFFDLLNIYEVQYHGDLVITSLKANMLKNQLKDSLVILYNKLDEEKKKELKEDIQSTFKEYEEAINENS